MFPFFHGYEICKEKGSEREAQVDERERKEETKERRKETVHEENDDEF